MTQLSDSDKLKPTEYAAGLKVAVEIAQWRYDWLQSNPQLSPIFLAGIGEVLVFLKGAESRASRGEDYRLTSTVCGDESVHVNTRDCEPMDEPAAKAIAEAAEKVRQYSDQLKGPMVYSKLARTGRDDFGKGFND